MKTRNNDGNYLKKLIQSIFQIITICESKLINRKTINKMIMRRTMKENNK